MLMYSLEKLQGVSEYGPDWACIMDPVSGTAKVTVRNTHHADCMFNCTSVEYFAYLALE